MIGNQRIIAVIIGRAGSRGLPGKNAILLAGRPMISYTIEHALQSDRIDRILVSTDGENIASAARSMDIEVVMRPATLASNTSPIDDAVRHAVAEAHDDAPLIVILYANVPVRPDGLIERAIDSLAETHADSVQSYCAVGKHHPFWMNTLDKDGRILAYIENDIYRRQDLPALYVPDGGVIVVRRDSLFRVDRVHPHAFLGADRRGITTQPGEVVDIDTNTDLRVAEAMLAELRTSQNELSLRSG